MYGANERLVYRIKNLIFESMPFQPRQQTVLILSKISVITNVNLQKEQFYLLVTFNFKKQIS